ncbi:MAG TPA: DUF4179 domain-containing protein [Chloroflexia bacterium]
MMNDRFIRDALDEKARRNTPAEADLWPGILIQVHREVSEQIAPTPWMHQAEPARTVRSTRPPADSAQTRRKRRLASGLSLASVATVLVLALGIAVFTLMSTPNHIYQPVASVSNPTPTHVAEQTPTTKEVPGTAEQDKDGWSIIRFGHVDKLGTTLNISQTIGGYTVTLLKAYADANHIAIVYESKGPEDERLAVGDIALKDANGIEFAPTFGTKGISGPQSGTYMIGFDAAALDNLPDELMLNLSLNLVKTGPAGRTPPSGPDESVDPDEWVISKVESMPRMAPLTPGKQWESVAGPFTFDFGVPVTHAGTRIAEVNQTVGVDGVNVTLEKVVVTQGETRAYLSFSPPDGDGTIFIPQVTLQVDDFSSQPGENHMSITSTEISTATTKDKWTYGTIASLTDKQGEWTLTVTELTSKDDFELGSDRKGTSSNPRHIEGPWVFKFTVPPAQK